MDMDGVYKSWTVQAVEEEGLPRTFGYTSRESYYQEVSSLQFIPAIKTTSLFLISVDDPFLGVVPDKECLNNPNTLLVTTKYGGHVAFLQGVWPFTLSWMDEVVMDFFDKTLKFHPASPCYAPQTSDDTSVWAQAKVDSSRPPPPAAAAAAAASQGTEPGSVSRSEVAGKEPGTKGSSNFSVKSGGVGDRQQWVGMERLPSKL